MPEDTGLDILLDAEVYDRDEQEMNRTGWLWIRLCVDNLDSGRSEMLRESDSESDESLEYRVIQRLLIVDSRTVPEFGTTPPSNQFRLTVHTQLLQAQDGRAKTYSSIGLGAGWARPLPRRRSGQSGGLGRYQDVRVEEGGKSGIDV